MADNETDDRRIVPHLGSSDPFVFAQDLLTHAELMQRRARIGGMLMQRYRWFPGPPRLDPTEPDGFVVWGIARALHKALSRFDDWAGRVPMGGSEPPEPERAAATHLLTTVEACDDVLASRHKGETDRAILSAFIAGAHGARAGLEPLAAEEAKWKRGQADRARKRATPRMKSACATLARLLDQGTPPDVVLDLLPTAWWEDLKANEGAPGALEPKTLEARKRWVGRNKPALKAEMDGLLRAPAHERPTLKERCLRNAARRPK